MVGALRRAVSRGLRRVVWRAWLDEQICGVKEEGRTGECLEGDVG